MNQKDKRERLGPTFKKFELFEKRYTWRHRQLQNDKI